MSYEVLILGLDRCGASIGMALRRAQGEVRRIGFDPEKRIARKAQELDAVDTLVHHPRGVIRTADLRTYQAGFLRLRPAPSASRAALCRRHAHHRPRGASARFLRDRCAPGGSLPGR